MKNIKLQEIENGWVVNYFSQHGNPEFDKTTFYKTFEEAEKGMEQWLKKVKE